MCCMLTIHHFLLWWLCPLNPFHSPRGILVPRHGLLFLSSSALKQSTPSPASANGIYEESMGYAESTRPGSWIQNNHSLIGRKNKEREYKVVHLRQWPSCTVYYTVKVRPGLDEKTKNNNQDIIQAVSAYHLCQIQYTRVKGGSPRRQIDFVYCSLQWTPTGNRRSILFLPLPTHQRKTFIHKSGVKWQELKFSPVSSLAGSQ